MPSIQVKPVFQARMRALCVRPYHGHPKGCPNFGKCVRCPPQAPLLPDVFDLESPCYVIYSVFHLGEHVDKMQIKHPDWSPHQLTCCLYWQGTARKRLAIEINRFLADYPEYLVNTTPEAMGLNVTETLKSVGMELEWPPRMWAVQVAFAGIERKDTL